MKHCAPLLDALICQLIKMPAIFFYFYIVVLDFKAQYELKSKFLSSWETLLNAFILSRK
jgi:hypothetical protein